ncbi:MAG: DUF3883 domain-containing protein [Phyllobacteriaceae bacterium]|nr:DUF3883 domain-containing protein [Phyllobacteriaceae bacterium]
MSSNGTDWTDDEVAACVAAYFDHLELDVSGERFNKAHLYRELTGLIPRTEKAIEFKFQNISAVLDQMGVEWIRGLAPRNNFQRALAEAVERRLPDFLAMDFAQPEEGLSDPAGLYIEPAPERATKPNPLPTYIERLVQKFDPSERDRRNRALGEAGEELVFQFEKHSLEGHQRDDLARKVRWVSKEDGDGAGFDILSFEPDGREKFVEVKTTTGSSRTPFFISRNETEFSRETGDRFRLMRLYDFRRSPRAFEMAGSIDRHVRLVPEHYRADFQA